MSPHLLGCFSCFDQKVQISKCIDAELHKQHRHTKKTFNVLLLGPGNSGKSTFLKQVKFLNGDKFSDEEKDIVKKSIYSNIISGMQVLFDAAVKLKIDFENKECLNYGKMLQSIPISNEEITADDFQNYSKLIKLLWEDSGIKTAYKSRHLFILVSN